MLKQKIESFLENWKNTLNKSPLIIKGQRQFGKTFPVRAFGEANYKNIVYLNFVKIPNYFSIFNCSLYFEKLYGVSKENVCYIHGCCFEKFLSVSAIRESGVYIFCIDVIKTTPDIATQKIVTPKNMLKVLSNSKDGKLAAARLEKDLIVKDLVCCSVNYCLNVPDGIKRAFFISGSSCILDFIGGDGVLLFHDNGGCWGFVSELHCDHQNLLVSRLCRVLATENEITFI